MIKVNKGTLKIDGTMMDICCDLYFLFYDLCTTNPELLAAVELEFEEKLLSAKINELDYNCAKLAMKAIREAHKKHEE